MSVPSSPYLTANGSHIARSNSTSELFSLSGNMIPASRSHKKRPTSRDFGMHSEVSSLSDRKRRHNGLGGPVPIDSDFSVSASHASRKKLTPYQIQRNKMRKSFQFPNGENFTPRKHTVMTKKNNSSTSLRSLPGVSMQRSGSMVSTASLPVPHSRSVPVSLGPRPPRSNVPFKSHLNNEIDSLKAQSPVNSKKSSESDNSMKDSLKGDSHSNDTVPTSDSAVSDTIPPVGNVKPIVILPNSVSMPDVTLRSATSRAEAFQHPITRVKSVQDESPKIVKEPSVVPTIKENDKTEKTQGKSKKRSSSSISGFGQFFKKLFGGKSKSSPKKRKVEPAVVKKDPVPETNKPVKSKVKKETTFDDISLKLDIEPNASENLMDTDLVFDSLLLKMNSPKEGKRRAIVNNCVDEPSNTAEKLNFTVEEKSADPNTVDYDLVNDFAKLGNFINLSISDDSMAVPPRSSKRPTLVNKRHASDFYNNQPTIVSRLEQQFEKVLVDEVPPKQTIMTTTKSILVGPRVDSTKSETKNVTFNCDVYMTSTYSPTEYSRKDKRFRKRMMTLMQGDLKFFEEVKRELNYYKMNEMPVHDSMRQYTQFFA
ncbi:Afr1 protein [Maudiozyma humilis]|uniref:Afr1 protein n=1 Tax=Maudiozyma humilis TaxID=51915 RepID=A0AAV5RXT7_MAUHU|nr:Afr1 protein [Kazachstania humilis]